MTTTRKTGGGPGTNQYAVRGTPKPKRRTTTKQLAQTPFSPPMESLSPWDQWNMIENGSVPPADLPGLLTQLIDSKDDLVCIQLARYPGLDDASQQRLAEYAIEKEPEDPYQASLVAMGLVNNPNLSSKAASTLFTRYPNDIVKDEVRLRRDVNDAALVIDILGF